MKEADRQRITRCLEEIDAWRASGVKLKDYAQSRGEELSHWRARLSWEQRWRQELSVVAGGTFVRAIPTKAVKGGKAQLAASAPTGQQQGQGNCVRIVLSREGGALRACVEWPVGAVQSSGAWLREVLA